MRGFGVLQWACSIEWGSWVTAAATLIFLSGFAVTVKEGPTLGLVVFSVAAGVWGLAAVWRFTLAGNRAERHIARLFAGLAADITLRLARVFTQVNLRHILPQFLTRLHGRFPSGLNCVDKKPQ
jgi:hypothetical protein